MSVDRDMVVFRRSVFELADGYTWADPSRPGVEQPVGPLLRYIAAELVEPWRDPSDSGTGGVGKIVGSPPPVARSAFDLLTDVTAGARDLEAALLLVCFDSGRRRPVSDEETAEALRALPDLAVLAWDRSSALHDHSGDGQARARSLVFETLADRAWRDVAGWHRRALQLVGALHVAPAQGGACHLCGDGTILVNPYNADEARCTHCQGRWSFSAGEWALLRGAA